MARYGRWIAGALVAEVATVALLAANSTGHCVDTPAGTGVPSTCTPSAGSSLLFDAVVLTLGLAILIYCVARAVIEGRAEPPRSPSG
ncbi:hypothetical protein [Microlunatus sp. GCM10028923]|uniref:hypothetical protein n=1 Tax=Microlunatus sp. GCM10028923 TaxID=3273400 RepID=UPI00361D5CDC